MNKSQQLLGIILIQILILYESNKHLFKRKKKKVSSSNCLCYEGQGHLGKGRRGLQTTLGLHPAVYIHQVQFTASNHLAHPNSQGCGLWRQQVGIQSSSTQDLKVKVTGWSAAPQYGRHTALNKGHREPSEEVKIFDTLSFMIITHIPCL